MRQVTLWWVRKVLSIFGVTIYRHGLVESLIERNTKAKAIVLDSLSFLPETNSQNLVEILKTTHSQHGQDFAAFYYNDFKHFGFFVEFGATNGISLSNTYLLEKKFKWDGILVEPARSYLSELTENRDSKIDTRALFSETGISLRFNEVKNRALSTIDVFSNEDQWADLRADGVKYQVETVSLVDLLLSHNAPDVIDFISIDTEGSEYEILKEFDFSRYRFNFISVEHNFNENRKKIDNLLVKNGYKNVHSEISFGDDWFIPVSRKPKVLETLPK